MRALVLLALACLRCQPPLEGAPCFTDLHCPTGQQCGDDGRCSLAQMGGSVGGGSVGGGSVGGGSVGGGSVGGGSVGGGSVGGGSVGGGSVGGGSVGGGSVGGGSVGGGSVGGGSVGGGSVGGGSVGGGSVGGGSVGGGSVGLPDGSGCSAPGQCISGACTTFYADSDSDGAGSMSSARRCGLAAPSGFVLSSGDCCDSDPRAKPGQTAFFTVTRTGCGGFDFNCDAVDEKEAAPTSVCPQTPPCDCATQAGWATPNSPACGATGSKVLASQCVTPAPPTCAPPKCSIMGPPTMGVTQACR